MRLSFDTLIGRSNTGVSLPLLIKYRKQHVAKNAIIFYVQEIKFRRDDLVQCVAQIPAGTSFWPKKSKLGYFRWNFNSSSTEAIRQKNKHLRYQLMLLVGFLVEKRANKNGFCSGE